MRIYILLFSILGFSIINCSAADYIQEKEIVIQKVSDGLFLGILIADLNEQEKKELKATSGALVVNVVEDSEAAKAGIKEKDVVINFDGQKIENAKELNDIVEAIKDETTVKMTVLRNGTKQSLEASLKKSAGQTYSFSTSGDDDFDWHFSNDPLWISEGGDHDVIIKKMKDGMVEISGSGGKGGFLGVEAKSLSEQMLEYFEVEHGVLIENVVKESAAQKAGLKAGDVITQIENRKIKDYNDLVRTVNFFNPAEKIKIDFVRKGTKKSVQATLEERKHGGIFINEDEDKTIIKESMGAPHKVIKKKHMKIKDAKDGGKNIMYII